MKTGIAAIYSFLLIMGSLISSPIPFGSGQTQAPVKISFKDMTLVVDLILGNSKNENESFARPSSVAVDDDRQIYVADYNRSRIAIFSATGDYLRTVGGTEKEDLKFLGPASICLDTDGTLYVSDVGKNSKRIISISKEGIIVKSFTTQYSAWRIFVFNKTIITLNRISEFNILTYSFAGDLVSKYDDVTNIEEEKARTCLTVDKDGSLYVSRTFIPLVKKYSAQGKELFSFEYNPIVAHKKEAIQIERTTRGRAFIFTGHENPVCLDVAVDSAGFIYLLVARDHEQPGLCALWKFNPSDRSFEVADLPFRCGKLRIDKYDNFYFIGFEEFPYVFRCHVEHFEKGVRFN